MTQFYELQLILLTGFCISALLLERYASKHQGPLTPKENRDPVHLENGNGHTHSASTSSNGALPTLTRKYLVVYAIVMGRLQFQLHFLFNNLTVFLRRRLVAGAICVFPLSRTIWISRENCRHPFRDWFHICWIYGTVSWRMG
jgi:hypothetical protein